MKLARIAFALAATLALAGCLLTPGKFTSDLTINADRSFTFAYKGEVIAVDPSSQMSSGSGEASAESTPEEKQAAAAKKVEVAKATAELEVKRKAIAGALAKEAGYRSVAYLGDGKYLIDSATSGVLTNNFIYPFNSDAEIVFPFIAVELRKDGTVRVKAPAFGKSGGKPAGMDMGMGMPDSTDNADGTFTLVTNAEIVMHNNEDGVKPAGAAKTLVWRVTPLSKDAPVAVLRMRNQN